MNGFSIQRLLAFFPIIVTLKNYSWGKFKADTKAGITISLLDLPQSMAFALLAGFPVAFGVYTSALGSIIGPIFASSRYLMMGPTNSTAILLLSSFVALNFSFEMSAAALPAFILMIGLLLILGSILRLAVILQYVSLSVITGYICAAACLTIVNQLDLSLGLIVNNERMFYKALYGLVFKLNEIKLTAIIISAVTFGFYFGIKRIKPQYPAILIAILMATLVANFLRLSNDNIVFVRPFESGIWPLTLPVFTFDIIHKLSSSALALAFLILLESASIAKTLAARSGETVDINQQMLSLGIANCASAFGSGMPISGSLSRSTLNCDAGSKTAISSVISGTILAVIVLFIGPYIEHVPIACLSTVIIAVALKLFQWNRVNIIINSTPSDAAVFFITFLGGLLLPLDTAIYLGAASSIILFLKKVSKPQLVEYAFNSQGELLEKKENGDTTSSPGISILHVEGDLFFGSSDIFLDQTRLLYDDPNIKVIIMRMKNAHHIDATSANAIADLIRFAREKGRDLIISGAGDDVEKVLKGSRILDIIGTNNYFPHTPQNPNLCVRNALKRAQEIIGQRHANIFLFSAPHEEPIQTAIATSTSHPPFTSRSEN